MSRKKVSAANKRERVRSFYEDVFGEEDVERDKEDWIPLSEEDLQQLFAQEASITAVYRWLFALFYEKRSKRDAAPKARSTVMMAPLYLFPTSHWVLLENMESDFKQCLKSSKTNQKVRACLLLSVSLSLSIFHTRT